MVHDSLLHKTLVSTFLTRRSQPWRTPRKTLRPCCSGLQVQGTTSSPSSTVCIFYINFENKSSKISKFLSKHFTREQKFDIITSRAVADLSKIAEYALPLLKHNGYFVAYKSRKTQEEIGNATNILKRYNAEVKAILTYTLPMEEVYVRNLVVIGFKNN